MNKYNDEINIFCILHKYILHLGEIHIEEKGMLYIEIEDFLHLGSEHHRTNKGEQIQ